MHNARRFGNPIHLTLVAASLAALTAACSRSQAATPPPTAQRPVVAAARAARTNLAETLTLAAEFRPFQEIDVHAKVAGYLKAIYVDVGDRVKAGQLLALLEVPELRDEAQQDDATVQRNTEEVNRAVADVARAESAHEVAHLAASRLAGVLKARPNLIAQQDVDEAAAKDRMAEAQQATSKAGLAAARQELAASKAMANKTNTLLGYTRIVAPFAGVITHRYADTGAMIQAGTSSQTQAMPVVKLSANDRLRLTIAVPESAVSRIRIGAPVEVRVEAVNRTFSGVVARFAGKVNPDTRTMETEVDVANPNLTLVPGMYAYASIAVVDRKGVLSVPVQALDRAEDKTAVMIVAQGVIERRDLSVGIESPDRVEITRGLGDGDVVIVGNRSQLRPGVVVTPSFTTAALPEGAR
jgi:RND family efflux transporter MFP subunit